MFSAFRDYLLSILKHYSLKNSTVANDHLGCVYSQTDFMMFPKVNKHEASIIYN
jgi:hypothetical protein